MSSIIISKSFSHALNQQRFPRKSSRSHTGIPWHSALFCLQEKQKRKKSYFPCFTIAQTAEKVVRRSGVKDKKLWVPWARCGVCQGLGQTQHNLHCPGSGVAPLPVSCQSWQVSLFKACYMSTRHTYLISSLPTVSAEDKEDDVWYL